MNSKTNSGKDLLNDSLNILDKNKTQINDLNNTYDLILYLFGTSVISVPHSAIHFSDSSFSNESFFERDLLKKYIMNIQEQNPNIVTSSDFSKIHDTIKNDGPFSKVIVVSDGFHFVHDNDKTADLSENALDQITPAKTPIDFLHADFPLDITDLAITGVDHESFGFIQNTTEITAHIFQQKAEGKEIQILLKEGDSLLGIEKHIITSQKNFDVSFKVKPEIVGPHVYSIEIPPVEGETFLFNNTFHSLMQITRDKIHVLQVAGRPTWDVRFLRQYLKTDPQIDLISFFILRNMEDNSKAPQEELSLIPFPTKELFQEKINSFDIIILQNFNPNLYGMRQYSKNIHDFVTERGGGLILLGGDNSFSCASPLDPYIIELLPKQNGQPSPCYTNQSFAMKFTETAKNHPLFVYGALQKTEAFEQGIPSDFLFGINHLLLSEPSIKILASSDTGNPLILAYNRGKGRVFQMMTDSFWKLKFSTGLSVKDSTIYQKFYDTLWNNSLHWLIKDPDRSSIRINNLEFIFHESEPIEISGQKMHSEQDESTQTIVRLESHDKKKDIIQEISISEKDPFFSFTFKPVPPGLYEIVFNEISSNKNIIQEDYRIPIWVIHKKTEKESILSGIDIKKTKTAPGTVQIHSLQNPSLKLIDDSKPAQPRFEVTHSSDSSVWQNIYFLMIFFLLATIAWLIRKRWFYD